LIHNGFEKTTHPPSLEPVFIVRPEIIGIDQPQNLVETDGWESSVRTPPDLGTLGAFSRRVVNLTISVGDN